MTEFDRMRTHLEDSVAMMPVEKRALFLLAYAQRLSPLFEEFERRAPPRRERFSQVLERLWRVAAGEPPNPLEEEVLDAMIPGEEWVVDGFYDTLAQDVGGLAVGALEGMHSPEGIVLHPEATVFDLIRLLLSEMRLGRTEPGEDEAGRLFDELLHTEPLVDAERRFWVGPEGSPRFGGVGHRNRSGLRAGISDQHGVFSRHDASPHDVAPGWEPA